MAITHNSMTFVSALVQKTRILVFSTFWLLAIPPLSLLPIPLAYAQPGTLITEDDGGRISILNSLGNVSHDSGDTTHIHATLLALYWLTDGGKAIRTVITQVTVASVMDNGLKS